MIRGRHWLLLLLLWTGGACADDAQAILEQVDRNLAPDSYEMYRKLINQEPDGSAAITLDYACLGCHTDQDVSWASSHAINIHESGLQTDIETVAEAPVAFALEQNYPNPFNASTTMAFDLPKASAVTLRIYGLDGRLLATLVENTMPPGRHTVKVDLGGLASGVYVYELRADDFVASKTMVLLK